MARTRLDVKEAAQVLGISTDAVHKRAKRGSLESEKDEDGRVFVWLYTEDNDYTKDSQAVQPLLAARLESENEFLRQELERRSSELAEMRRIVAGLVQRIPELEPANTSSETRESPIMPSEAHGKGRKEGATNSEEPHRSWWVRFFFGS
jgi:hypothetical protein